MAYFVTRDLILFFAFIAAVVYLIRRDERRRKAARIARRQPLSPVHMRDFRDRLNIIRG